MSAAGRPSLKGRAIAWLAQREQSRVELRRKLLVQVAREARAEAESESESAIPASVIHRSAADASATPRSTSRDSTTQGRAFRADTTRQADDDHGAEARVDALLDWLEAHGYLSPERFAESRIHVRAPRFGLARIRQELAQHGVGLQGEALQQLQATEFERARAVWARKFKAPAPDAAGRARQARFLTARGFSGEVVRRIVRASAED